jgi:hypothetical protein
MNLRILGLGYLSRPATLPMVGQMLSGLSAPSGVLSAAARHPR